MEKSPKQQAGYWSTCAYLINKAVMKPILDRIWTVSCKTQIFIFSIICIKQPFDVLKTKNNKNNKNNGAQALSYEKICSIVIVSNNRAEA